jgi:DNA-binding NarL/FixJ family response regulator
MHIILSDHHVQPLLALNALLDEHPEFNVIGSAADAESLLVLTENSPADLILIDEELPGSNIDDLITRLHEIEPRPIVIVMSSEIEHSRRLLKAGADAFVSKGDTPDWLLEILQKFESRLKKDA